MNRKVKSFKQCFYHNYVQCQTFKQLFEVRSFSLDTGAQSFCHSFIALLIRCSKSAQKSAVQVCQVAMLLWKPQSWF